MNLNLWHLCALLVLSGIEHSILLFLCCTTIMELLLLDLVFLCLLMLCLSRNYFNQKFKLITREPIWVEVWMSLTPFSYMVLNIALENEGCM